MAPLNEGVSATCPRCGKRAGELVNAGAGRFPFFVSCKACSFTTEHVRTAGVAVKLWNEAKAAKEKSARGKRLTYRRINGAA